MRHIHQLDETVFVPLDIRSSVHNKYRDGCRQFLMDSSQKLIRISN